jgi:CheY-like chemotaxis protein
MNEGIISVEAAAAASVQAQANPPRRILVVDDNDDLRQLSVDVLVDSGFDVEAVNDGAAGWEALQIKSYDLVITDNKMPKMTGLEMIEKLRTAGMKVPIMMATGSLPMNEFASKPWLYPDATLQRPFTNEAMLETVKKVLRRDDSYNAHMKMLLAINP